MATKKLFDLTEKTTLADTDKLAGGTSTQNAFNITWANFNAFLKGIFAKKEGDLEVDFNALHAYIGKNSGTYSTIDGNTIYSRLVSTNADVDFHLNRLQTIVAKPDGTFQAIAFIPFTGCHLAEYQGQDFKDFQLVKIKSTGFSSDKQPIWEASFANPNEKGIFGVVYGLNIVPVMEEYEEEELQEVPITEKEIVLEVIEIDGVYKKVPTEKEVPVMDKKQIDGTDEFIEVQKTEKIQVLVKRTRQIGEIKHWMIASVGDMPMFVCGENGNIEYGDKLTPSSINGVAMKANTNSPICGIAGQSINFDFNEIVKIGVTKE